MDGREEKFSDGREVILEESSSFERFPAYSRLSVFTRVRIAMEEAKKIDFHFLLEGISRVLS